MMVLTDVLSKLGFDWQVALANVFNFLLIIWLIKKMAFKPISQNIKNRQEIIARGLDNAKTAEIALQSAKKEEERIISEAKVKASEIIYQAKNNSNEIIASAKESAVNEAQEIIKKAKKNAEEEMIQAKKEVEKHASNLVSLSLSKIMDKDQGELDKILQQKIGLVLEK